MVPPLRLPFGLLASYSLTYVPYFLFLLVALSIPEPTPLSLGTATCFRSRIPFDFATVVERPAI